MAVEVGATEYELTTFRQSLQHGHQLFAHLEHSRFTSFLWLTGYSVTLFVNAGPFQLPSFAYSHACFFQELQ